MSRRLLVVIEEAARNYSAYTLDLPGCVATGRTRRIAGNRMRGAIKLHLRGMKEDGVEVSKGESLARFVAVK